MNETKKEKRNTPLSTCKSVRCELARLYCSGKKSATRPDGTISVDDVEKLSKTLERLEKVITSSDTETMLDRAASIKKSKGLQAVQ